MKNVLKLLKIFAVLTMISVSFVACGDYKTYKQNDGTLLIENYRGKDKNPVIPNIIKEKKVTFIGFGAFSNKNLTGITIPDSIVVILDDAFINNQLTSVTIPNSVTKIGYRAFSNNQLTSVTIPNSVIEIGSDAFSNNQLTSVTIPNSIIEIGSDAFSNNQLTSVIIPNGVTKIGSNAFNNNQLTSVTIPSGVTVIYNNAFSNNQLTSVTIPKNDIVIFPNAFRNNKLTKVVIQGDCDFYINSFDDDVLINGRTIESYRNIEFFTKDSIFASSSLIINYNTNTVLTSLSSDNSVELGIRFNDKKRKTGTMIINSILVGGQYYRAIVDDYNIVLYAINDPITFEIIDGQDGNIMKITLRGKEYLYKEDTRTTVNRSYKRW